MSTLEDDFFDEEDEFERVESPEDLGPIGGSFLMQASELKVQRDRIKEKLEQKRLRRVQTAQAVVMAQAVGAGLRGAAAAVPQANGGAASGAPERHRTSHASRAGAAAAAGAAGRAARAAGLPPAQAGAGGGAAGGGGGTAGAAARDDGKEAASAGVGEASSRPRREQAAAQLPHVAQPARRDARARAGG
eukprot:CAMPEP_0196774996 /NCGR_PEP_ID=MMETSP1104-20130614/3762_1 /TAXON_ID=33652 /ORGANISM="Cafeteria sp., Strain Caron Lab Isolate" /LENGTH=189 /DNA_ID=CAMNT_0042145159 /DNA_START=40 /DNA_END=604 /DNA_ORIENTATION=-